VSRSSLIAGALGAVLFLLCAAVQWNDPDPLPWIALYGAAAAVCLAFAWGKDVALGAVVVAAWAVSWGTTRVPAVIAFVASERTATNFSMKTDDVVEEEAREGGGLALVAVVCGAVALVRLRRRPPT
jgi:hypothetical protein